MRVSDVAQQIIQDQIRFAATASLLLLESARRSGTFV